MVEVGELSIGAGIDIGALEESLNRMESQLDDVGGKFDSVNSDMVRAEQSSRGLSIGFLSITAATASIYGLAKSAPQLAGSLAEMQIAMMEVSFALGDALAPAFDTVAGGMLDFADWLQKNSEFVDDFGSVINDVLIVAIEGIKIAWSVLDTLHIPDALKWIVDNVGSGTIGGAVLGGLIGFSIGGLPGAVIGMGAGGILGNLGDQVSDLMKNYNVDSSSQSNQTMNLSQRTNVDPIEAWLSSLANRSNRESQSLNSSDNYI